MFSKPVEFCSDMFLLPLGIPPIDSIDLGSDSYIRNPRPDPPPREFIPNVVPKSPDMLSYYEMLLSKLEFNNNEYVNSVLSKDNSVSSQNNSVLSKKDPPDPPRPPSRQTLEPIFESQESDEML